MTVDKVKFLKRVLTFDALTCMAMGALLLGPAGTLGDVFGLPSWLLRSAGLILVAFAALLVSTARRPFISPTLLSAIVIANFAWVIASMLLLLNDAVSPTPLGTAFVIAQAVGVLVLAAFELIGLRLVQGDTKRGAVGLPEGAPE